MCKAGDGQHYPGTVSGWRLARRSHAQSDQPMVIALPSAEELDQYRATLARRAAALPLIADDEAVCQVHVLDSGRGAYWAHGDVEVHVRHARQHRLAEDVAHVPPQAWLAQALRERRAQRQRLLSGGVQTTASGLFVLQAPTQLVIPGRR